MFDVFMFDLAHLMLRFFHVIAGIAWIGASFYFVWLDNNLEAPSKQLQQKGVAGQLHAVHGGGFYEVVKYRNGPEQIPSTLHWFKWEAYTTWMTGALLLSLLYYIGADFYLLAPEKSDISRTSAMLLAASSIVLTWAVYDTLCRTRVIHHGTLFLLIMTALLSALTWFLDQYLQTRAVLIHIGAAIGTCMAGNVMFSIIPSQRYMVKEVTAGREPDPAIGQLARQRSVHNNYTTLPIIFIMLSSHFTFATGSGPLWLVLPLIGLIGVWIRHYFNLKNRGQHRPAVLVSGLGAFVVLMIVLQWPQAPVTSADASPISEVQALTLINAHCTGCHSATPSSPMFQTAPANLQLDSLQQIEQASQRIHARAVVSRDMPLGNMTGMTDAERDALGRWLNSKP